LTLYVLSQSDLSVDPWRVFKFGGSSVADAARMARVADIIEQDTSPRLAIVMSACRGVTDQLLALIGAAERPAVAPLATFALDRGAQEPTTAGELDVLRDRHAAIASALLDAVARSSYLAELDADLGDLHGLLQTTRLIRTASPAMRDIAAGFGEIWSTRLFWRYLTQRRGRPGRVDWIDAREIIRVVWGALGPKVQWTESQANADRLVPRDREATLVIPGFVARDAGGLQTTLGRDGSDFSASIFGSLLGAAEIHIWTDVDGILSADPRLVPDARVIASLSYQEAMELAYFGAKVIHPQTMAPAVGRSIPIRIRNTFAPEKPGTLIAANPPPGPPVKGISSIDRVALVNVEGAGMIGVPGTAERLFSALREHAISVILISQGSSEHSICFAVPLAEASTAESVVRLAFASELKHGQIQRVDVMLDCSILAVVGDGMAGMHGVAANVFGALGTAHVNVRAIAQGASERNISVVIEAQQTTRALGAVHSRFYLSPHTISIGLIGPGLVGSALIGQMATQIARLERDANLDLRLRGVMTTRHMALADPALSLTKWREALAQGGPPDLAAFEAHVQVNHLPHAMILDCTASAEIAQAYPRWLAAGIHVITPNKKANSAAIDFTRQIRDAQRRGGSYYLYEATVGAGLPVIQTLRDLRETGDEIRRIEGILSGTLSYLFNAWDGRQPFSAVVRDARHKGYTEPDPRDDLTGMDVARKLTILGREMGLAIDVADVEVESLVPAALGGCSEAEFLERMGELDAPMLARWQKAEAHGHILRYVGALDAATRRASVGLVELERSHPFANINLTDNVVRFVTARYDRNPLVVQGPGAGPEVTAAGVFADLLRACAYLGAKL
jgi:aspartokinase/homoserine dehydrogenase 1